MMTKTEKDEIKVKISKMDIERIEKLILSQELRVEKAKFILDALIAEKWERNSKKGGNVNR
ncbi:Uncharacterised protein [Sebaldella termitidis]|nr:Uncharacterised protein [Sebaldella termitidis]